MFVACDESGIDSSDKYLVIGAVWVSKEAIIDLEKDVTELRIDRKCWGEIKWEKVRKGYTEHFYKSFIDTVLDGNEVFMSFIIVDKSLADLKVYHKGNPDLMRFKFTYLLLSRNAERLLQTTEERNEMHVVLDSFEESTESRDEKWFAGLRENLERHLGCEIDHVQTCTSHICSLIQFCDLYTGAVATLWNTSPSKITDTKKDLIDYMESKIDKKLNVVTLPTSKKLNIWPWRPAIDLSKVPF